MKEIIKKTMLFYYNIKEYRSISRGCAKLGENAFMIFEYLFLIFMDLNIY